MQKARLILRRWWLGFALLIALGLVGDLFFSAYGSAWERCGQYPRRYAFTAGHAALFGLLAAATYSNRKLLWWAAIGSISLKLYRLLKYYTLVDYEISSTTYNQDYMRIFYQLQPISHWLVVPGGLLFDSHALSAAFLATLYVYWLTLCRKLLHAKPELLSL
ncbi:hypothetical protein QMK33_03020 [Hymenobacter sp. H14-R3]|uniref:hypothetical protein n=1 Tax=Hymenobacter sp. H14-R3 TaxID=3046308 RepID=UPI0024B88DE8|nr:hypothetical protein [Hymenobacter sp. H14-R3]MDJ0364111.1 hypothetical protein [Hymenobacter sp. H14-R3]